MKKRRIPKETLGHFTGGYRAPDSAIYRVVGERGSDGTIRQFQRANRDAPLDPWVYKSLRALRVGQTLKIHLGAGGAVVFKRVK